MENDNCSDFHVFFIFIFLFVCIIFPSDCGTPSKEGYKFSAPDPNTLFEGTVNVSCADCYEGSPDKPSLSCNADGNWTDVEGCTKTGTCMAVLVYIQTNMK